MARTRIKICGIRRAADAVAAAQAGADAIGMVFHPAAARFIDENQAREILAALPPFVTPVGLFVDAPINTVRQTARSLGLRHIQLHGHEDAAYIRELAEFVILKAVRVDRSTFSTELAQWRSEGLANLAGIILETPSASPGGTGLVNDWDFVRECRSKGLFQGLPAIIAAGGLTPENVAAVVRDVQPWAVDVSSGVESSKGVKSAEKMAEFVKAARSNDQ
ncbi:MAG TPA: phosphoribosylanthranilate isomerase [Tepidisphaeraceae bacterium]|jgi:phosphoribosylanthranilate isomerase|nr:phosphoribosylanthranilate isomerase [Tepidisphaeraceae bacterium]